MPFWHTAGIPQAFAWSVFAVLSHAHDAHAHRRTLLSPYLVECPAENPRIEFPIFPTLNILNNPNATALVNTTVPGEATTPAITHNRTTPLSAPGRVIDLSWELPGKNVSYNNSYTTSIMATGPAKFAAWISQLNVTYTPLVNVSGTVRCRVLMAAAMGADDVHRRRRRSSRTALSSAAPPRPSSTARCLSSSLTLRFRSRRST
jgi:hypothetical protein